MVKFDQVLFIILKRRVDSNSAYLFNQKVKLPEKLTHLTFGTEFNQEVILPEKLTHLTLDYYFDKKIKLSHLNFHFK